MVLIRLEYDLILFFETVRTTKATHLSGFFVIVYNHRKAVCNTFFQ